MKKIENSFVVTGFIGKDAEIRSFATASVARFSVALSRPEKSEENPHYISAFIKKHGEKMSPKSHLKC